MQEQTIARYKNAVSSAQKLRLIADQIRGVKVSTALNFLMYNKKKAAVLIKKVLESAIANSEHNDGANIDELKIIQIYIDKGSTIQRSFLRAKGRTDRIVKHRSHITIIVSSSTTTKK
ncbi:MAG: 50S ribosomal protein L22 [Candidatus Dasytiphilus stammeri]